MIFKNIKNKQVILVLFVIIFLTSCPSVTESSFETYNISFHTDSDSTVIDQVVLEGEKIIKPTDPIKLNSTFIGWFTNTNLETLWPFDDSVYEDMTLTAGWESLPSYKISFELNNNNSISYQSIYKGGYISQPEIPTKDDFTFTNWYSDISCTNIWAFYVDTVNSDMTLYAGWTSLPTYKVIFNTNLGYNLDDQTIIHGHSVQIPTNPSREGYYFSNWYSDYNLTFLWDFSSKLYNDITLYAAWDKAAYTISFETNSDNYISTIISDYGLKIDDPIEPGKDGYTFSGWYSDSSLINEWEFDKDVITSDLTLYASWEPLPRFTVSFSTNGGSIVDDVLVYENGSLDKPTDPTKSDYRFFSWYSDESFTDEWDFINDNILSDKILYAKYTKIGVISESGGLIFYDDEEDGIDDLPSIRYLEIAPMDFSTDLVWGDFELTIDGADGTEIGTGYQNTLDVISDDETTDKAVDFCYNYSVTTNGLIYNNWYLPSINELKLIYTNLKFKDIGEIPSQWYWSSSESSSSKAYVVSFSGGGQYQNSKSVSNYVIPIRAY